ncbi:MAG: DUF4831 family protein [Prevotellaceae bacterium]|jgi:hypothetical protein|nr:DUF4831 family protein [Prevotellaceae bacterium]
MRKNVLLLAIACMFSSGAAAQTPFKKGYAVPENSMVVYALPYSVIEIQAEAVHELFTAGPYARYAQKYLGMAAEMENRETFHLKSIALRTLTEADASQIYSLEIKEKNASANFFALSAEGLIASLDPAGASASAFRFATTAQGKFNDTGAEPNIGSDKVTLYKNVQTPAGYEKVPVQQHQLIEKNPERRAEEAANFIFNLRKKRVELITGETESTWSNDGLNAALEEIKRLEEEYLSLFLGKTTTGAQSAVFHVTPDVGQAKQLYVAFRFSDTQGLLPASNVAGRPVTLELVSEKKVADIPSNLFNGNDKRSPRIAYRLPDAVQARINDGQTNLLQTRLLVYQFGQILSFPVNLKIK